MCIRDRYDTLLTCEGEKVFVAKNTEDSKVAVLSLDLNYSNLSLLYEFPVMMSNLFDYFLPSTVSETVYDVAPVSYTHLDVYKRQHHKTE